VARTEQKKSERSFATLEKGTQKGGLGTKYGMIFISESLQGVSVGLALHQKVA
jgi:hypothetical protein